MSPARPLAVATLLGAAALAACTDAATTTGPEAAIVAAAGGGGARGDSSAVPPSTPVPAPGAPASPDSGAPAPDVPPDPTDRTDVPGTVWAPGAPGADSVGGLGRVAGATVRALREPSLEETARVTTGNDGAFTFRALPGGRYTFEAAPPAGSALAASRMRAVTVTRGRFGTMTFPGAANPSAPSTLHEYRALNVILWPPR